MTSRSRNYKIVNMLFNILTEDSRQPEVRASARKDSIEMRLRKQALKAWLAAQRIEIRIHFHGDRGVLSDGL